MDALKTVLVLAIVVPAIYGAVLQLPQTRSCMTDGECGTGECCAKQLGPLIVSRKRDAFTTPDPATVQGTCKPYLKHGEWCGGIWTQNGFCGCAPSLTCHRYPLTGIVTRGKRKMLAGNYLCEPKEMGP